ncbi:methylenetetrahydrofolate reductase [Arthrobacter sp. Bz4]|uniref:methylenetetrahydrofolate reductase n=1 Tax=Arthrobacter sp. Bz4 TaxID=2171979 RepID=UPI000D51AD6D|nr:methylenetetrahydrofolate reductase [Arthrobacter sp. Bz4]PVE17777.1 5,10-methylenetetrahydrofolate reductase [Arthrobacter sp. Bz4]
MWRARDFAKPSYRRLLETARYEILPTAAIADEVMANLPVGRRLTITASAGKGLAATLAVTETLSRAGYQTIPHVAARMVQGRQHLEEIIEQLVAAGVDSVFIPAGDARPDKDSYAGSLELLRDLTALGRPFRSVGVAGYPESHPVIADDVTIQAMWDKRNHATNVVSNLCLDPAVIAAWIERVRKRGVLMPLWIGMPGPVERSKLLSVATRIGVGESTRFLAKNTSLFARLAAPGGYSPERFLDRLAPALVKPESRVEGLHIYTFNQVRQAEEWRRNLIGRLGGSVS